MKEEDHHGYVGTVCPRMVARHIIKSTSVPGCFTCMAELRYHGWQALSSPNCATHGVPMGGGY